MDTIVPHAAHWGFFDAVVRGGRVVGARPFARDVAPARLIAATAETVHSPARIDRPYIRKGWLHGKRAGHLRGGDPFVPVSWDTAIRLLAEETARVRAEHGGQSIFGGSYGWASAGRFHHARTQLQRHLALGGGFTNSVNAYSYATAQALLPHVLGDLEVLLGRMTDWAAIARHAKLMLCLGGLAEKNGQVTSGAAAQTYVPNMMAAARAGVRFVSVSPFRGDTMDAMGAEWVPIRPGTDTALLLAMIRHILDRGMEDRGFLRTHVQGWDRFAATLGERTPEWAEGVTGIPAGTIRRLAEDCASHPTMLTAAWSLQRADHGEQPYWALVALAAAIGGIGRPGQGVGFGYGSSGGIGNPRRALPAIAMPAVANPVRSFIPVGRITELLENPGATLRYNGMELPLPDIRMVWWAGGNPFHHHQDLNRLLRAWSKPDTIVVQEPWWTAPARHADIVLPATTTLERNDIASTSRDRFVRAMHRAIPPLGQARPDHDILADLSDAAGFRDRFTEQRDEGAWLRHLYGRWQAACARMGWEPPDFDRFWAEGHAELPPIEPSEEHTQFTAFRADPEAHPLDTPSGRVEVFSDAVAAMALPDCPGCPSWIPPRESLLSAAPGEMHLLSFQPATRLHSQLDPGPIAAADKIQGREPLLMGAGDAAARGLADGQVVRVWNARGACLAGLRVRDGIVPGVALMATGAWFDPLEPGRPGSLCVHGNPNVLTADIGTSRLGQGPSAQSCLVRVEAWEGDLPPVRVHAPPPIEETA